MLFFLTILETTYYFYFVSFEPIYSETLIYSLIILSKLSLNSSSDCLLKLFKHKKIKCDVIKLHYLVESIMLLLQDFLHLINRIS